MNKTTKLLIIVLLISMTLTPVAQACHDPPEPVEVRRVAKFTTTIKNTHLMYYWNGFGWPVNHNTTAVIIGNRTILTYHYPPHS